MAPIVTPNMLPTPPTRDPLGNLTPAGLVASSTSAPPGADALSQDQSPEDNGTLPMPTSGGATIGDQLRAKGSPVLQALAQHTDTAIKKNPTLASKPGGLWQALISGTMGAIGGLGDASAVGTVPSGGGALEGLTRTLAARNQRLTAQKQQQFQNQQEADKNKVLNAEANARMVHEQQLTHNLKEEGTAASLKSGQEQLAAWKNQPNPGIERAKGLTADQAKDLLKKDGLDPTEETLVPSGVITTVDKDGQPYNQLTYSVVRVTPVDLDPKDKDQKAVLDRINKYAPPESGKTWEGENGKPVHFSGAQYNMLLQMANERQAADIASQKVAAQLGIAGEDVKKTEEAMKFRQDPNIINALAKAQSINGVPDFISARNALFQASQNPKSPLYGKYGNIDNDMREYLGYTENTKGEKSYIYDKMLDDFQKKQDTAMELYTDFFKKADTATGADAASMASVAATKAKDPDVPPALRTAYAKKAVQLKDQAQAAADFKTQEKEAEIAATQGDPAKIAPMIVDPGGAMDPSQLSKRGSIYSNQLTAIDDYAKQKYGNRPSPDGYFDGNHFNIAKAQTDYKFANRGDTQNTLKYLNSLTGGANQSGGNLSELLKKSDQITRTEFPALNDAAAWARLQTGDPNIVGYKTTVLEVADQVAKILQGGGTGNGTSDAKLKQAQDMFNSGFTKDQIKEVANSLQPLLANRRDSIIGDNRYLINQFGKAPNGAVNKTPGKAANGTMVWKMPDGSVQDSLYRKYDPKTGQMLTQ